MYAEHSNNTTSAYFPNIIIYCTINSGKSKAHKIHFITRAQKERHCKVPPGYISPIHYLTNVLTTPITKSTITITGST